MQDMEFSRFRKENRCTRGFTRFEVGMGAGSVFQIITLLHIHPHFAFGHQLQNRRCADNIFGGVLNVMLKAWARSK